MHLERVSCLCHWGECTEHVQTHTLFFPGSMFGEDQGLEASTLSSFLSLQQLAGSPQYVEEVRGRTEIVGT